MGFRVQVNELLKQKEDLIKERDAQVGGLAWRDANPNPHRERAIAPWLYVTHSCAVCAHHIR